MKISEKFKELKEKKEKALITYVTGGDPDYDTSKEIVKLYEKCGADMVEIGIPFSDPMADGPVVQNASERALKNGYSLRNAITMTKELRDEGVKIPLIFMSYYNPIYVYGLENFVKDAKKAGVNGVIIPDLPPEEADEFLVYTKQHDLDVIFLLAPTLTDERIEKVVSRSKGFIYFVSVAGTTGVRSKVNANLPELVKRVREKTDLPIGIGFGVSSKEQVKEISGYADGAIVASAILKIIESNLLDKGKMLAEIEKFVKELKAGTR